ncbi:MAG TPA: ATP synthase F0 subunit B [Verrucomicrobiae bacterium]|nr:ATP synthase F0 subunit B [Verrucomicrobiae bacterium]
MKSAGRFALLFCLAGCALAAGKEGGEDSLLIWKWANLVVLAGGLGYLMAKSLPPLFAARTQAILKDMLESQKVRQEADARAAEVDRRLDAIDQEIAALKAESHAETTAEADRLAKHAAGEIARIRAQAEREISDAGKTAQKELRRYTAGLAIELAGKKIGARMTPANEDRLVRGFVRDLR